MASLCLVRVDSRSLTPDSTTCSAPAGNSAAVDPVHHAGALQDGEVAADRLGGDPIVLGEFGDRGPPR